VATVAPKKRLKHDLVAESSRNFKVDPMCKGEIEEEQQRKQKEDDREG